MKYAQIILKSFFLLILVLGLSLVGLYYSYDSVLPEGEQGVEADRLAKKMLDAMNYEAYKELDYIEWTFSSRGKGRHFKWHKAKGRCTVTWDSISVNLSLISAKNSTIKINGQNYEGDKKKELIRAAEAKFNNDSFWLVAPYKVFDRGVERRIVSLADGEKGLLVTYTSGGTTPGDSYLWRLDETYLPKAFEMWVDIIPIGGIAATWENWLITPRGAYLPQLHRLLFLDLEISNLKFRN